jgi:hypothetical protein
MIFDSNFKMRYSRFSLAMANHLEGCGPRATT